MWRIEGWNWDQISEVQKFELEKSFKESEVHQAVFDCNGSKAPEPMVSPLHSSNNIGGS